MVQRYMGDFASMSILAPTYAPFGHCSYCHGILEDFSLSLYLFFL